MDSTRLNCSGVQVGDFRFRSFKEREEEGFIGLWNLGIGRLLVVGGGGEEVVNGTWELAGEGDLDLGSFSFTCARSSGQRQFCRICIGDRNRCRLLGFPGTEYGRHFSHGD